MRISSAGSAMRPARVTRCRKRSAPADNSPSSARRPRPRWSSVSARSVLARAVLGSPPVRSRAPAMPPLSDVIAGPWRAVLVLGVTEILAWGAIFYPPVLTVPLIAHERGWSMTFAMGGFSLALLTAGLVSPRVGKLIDRHGGHCVMPIGSLIAALWLALIVYVDHPAAYLAVWLLLGVATAATLYDPAFATLGRIFGAAARRPITALTLAGGFASTVSWPATHVLLEAVGWRGTYLVYAALLALVAAPLHAFALPRTRANVATPSDQSVHAASVVLPRPAGLSCWWRRRSRLTPSCRRACPRICSRSSAAPASMRRRWWRLARCSGPRRSRRVFASSCSRAASIRSPSRASRSRCCSRRSR